MSARVAISDGSQWPRPALESDERYGVGHKLRYGGELTQSERLEAASIIDAYGYLVVEASLAKLATVARELRRELKRPKPSDYESGGYTPGYSDPITEGIEV